MDIIKSCSSFGGKRYQICESTENGYESDDSDIVCLGELPPKNNKTIDGCIRSWDNILADEIQRRMSSQFDNRSKAGMKKYYSESSYAYLKVLEQKHRPSPCCSSLQGWESDVPRKVVISIITYITVVLELEDEVLHLAISYWHRFLSVVPVKGENERVISGLSCLILAMKYDSDDNSYVGNLCDAVKNFCSNKQLNEMERRILTCLSFDLNDATIYSFLTYMCFSMGIPDIICHLSQLMAEIAFRNFDVLLRYLPSQIAAAAIYAANYVAQVYDFDSELECVSGYKIPEIISCVDLLYKGFLEFRVNPFNYVYDKYKSENYSGVSDLIILESPV